MMGRQSRETLEPANSRLVSLDSDGDAVFAAGDMDDPKNSSKPRRWCITVATIMACVNSTFASSAPSGSIKGVAEQLGLTVQVAGLCTTLFLLGYCPGALMFAPLSEFYGRQKIFYITAVLYFAFSFLCAFTRNFAGLLVGRFLTGTFASASLSNVPGVLTDIWDHDTRGLSMAIFSIAVQVGPAIGPVVCGFCQLTVGWRWSYYVLIIFGVITAIPLVIVPETYAPVLLQRKVERIRQQNIPGYENSKARIEDAMTSVLDSLANAAARPWRILFDPIAFGIALYITFPYTLVYMLFSVYPIIYQQHRGWNAGVGQLPVLTSGVGGVIGGVICFFYEKHATKHRSATPVPEGRLVLAMVGGACLPCFMFLFAWTGNYDWMPWGVLLLGGGGVSACIMMIFNSIINSIVDTYTRHAASAIASNTVSRSTGAASAPLWTNYMFDALGVGKGGSVIAAASIALAFLPFIFFKYGAWIRSRSKFANSKP